MAETSGKAEPQEPSMEDILASIRRILSEDGTPGEDEASAAETRHGAAPATATNPGDGLEAEENMSATSAPASAASLAEELFDTPPEPSRASAETARVPSQEEDVFVLTPEMRVAGHTLVSEQVAYDSTDVLSQLARAILDRRDIAVATRDVTLEGMVREMLRPLLRHRIHHEFEALERLAQRRRRP